MKKRSVQSRFCTSFVIKTFFIFTIYILFIVNGAYNDIFLIERNIFHSTGMKHSTNFKVFNSKMGQNSSNVPA